MKLSDDGKTLIGYFDYLIFDIPNSVTHIANEAFKNCTRLGQLTIPNSLTHIGNGAFWGCTGLSQLFIPNSVTHIGDGAFADCPRINEMRRKATNELIAICFSSLLPKVLRNIVLEYETPKSHLMSQMPLPHDERLLPLYQRRLNLLISTQKHLVNNLEPNDSKQAIKRILLNYLEGRINVMNSSGDTAQHFHARFFPFQKSFSEKEKAVYALLDALDGNSHGLEEHISTLRNGRLGKALREFIQKGGAFDIVSNVTTVRQFVGAIANLNSVKARKSCSDTSYFQVI